MFSKEIIYPFTQEGINQIKIDRQKQKINNIGNIIFYLIIAVLLLNGTIGKKFIIESTVCSMTSKLVKWLIR